MAQPNPSLYTERHREHTGVMGLPKVPEPVWWVLVQVSHSQTCDFFCSDPEVGFQGLWQATERDTVGWGTCWGVLKPAQRCAGLGGSGLWGSPPCSSRCALPASLPLRRSLSTPQKLVHLLCSSHLPGAVSILTFQLPTCHHPSQAIRIIVQEFPPRFWDEW